MKVSRLPRRIACAGVAALLLLGVGAAPGGAVEPLRPAPAQGDSAVTTAAPDSSRTVHAMDEARLPKTKAASGRRIGAIIGGASGLGFGILLGLLIDALSEGEGGDGLDGAGEWAAWLGVTTASGAVGGGLIGTIIGSAIPARQAETPAELRREDETPRGQTPARLVRPARRTGPVGSITLEGLYGDFPTRDAGQRGAGGRLTLQAHRGPRFRIGLEHARLYTGPRLTFTGFVARAAPFPGLFVVLAVGNDRWSSDLSLTGGSLGLALETSRPEARSSWVVEARYHFTLQRFNEANRDFKLVTLAAGRRFGW